MKQPRYCPGEEVDFLGHPAWLAQEAVEILVSEFCPAGDTVFDHNGRPLTIREDSWWYRHTGSEDFFDEDLYRKRPKNAPISDLLKREEKA